MPKGTPKKKNGAVKDKLTTQALADSGGTSAISVEFDILLVDD